MTSKVARYLLATRLPLTTCKRQASGEFREIRATGFAPKYKDEFAKIRYTPREPPLITSNHLIVAALFLLVGLHSLRKYIGLWSQEAMFRRETDYRKAKDEMVAKLVEDYKKIV